MVYTTLEQFCDLVAPPALSLRTSMRKPSGYIQIQNIFVLLKRGVMIGNI